MVSLFQIDKEQLHFKNSLRFKIAISTFSRWINELTIGFDAPKNNLNSLTYQPKLVLNGKCTEIVKIKPNMTYLNMQPDIDGIELYIFCYKN